MKYRVLLLLVFTLIYNCAEEVPANKPLFEFIPENSTLVVEINNLPTFRESFKTNNFLLDLGKLKTFKSSLEKIRFIDFVSTESKSVLAFMEVKTAHFEPIWIIQNSPEIFVPDSVQNRTTTQVEHKGLPLVKQQIKDLIFFSKELGSKIVISSSPDLMVDFIDNLKGNKPPESLRKLINISNDHKMASFFIDIKRSGPLFNTYLQEASKLKISSFSDWMSLDIDAKPTQLNLTGISIANDSIWSYIDLFANTRPREAITPTIAPGNSDMIISYTFDDYQIFSRNQQGYLGGVSKMNMLLEDLGEIGVIHIGEHQMVILNTQGSEALATHLNATKKGSFDFQGNEIIRLEDPEFLNSNFKPMIVGFKSNFGTIIANSFTFAERRQDLEGLIRKYKDGNTFNKTSTYEAVTRSIAEESNISLMSSSNGLKKVLSNDFSAAFNQELVKGLGSDYAIAAQTSADKNFYHTNVVLRKVDGAIEENGVTELFSVKLDTMAATDPQFVINHLNQKREVVVQDLKNNLYLISNTGKIIWKKQLQGTVQGEIKQVDIFKNGRLQLAFTTANQFIVLDRNGKEVPRFSKTYEGGNLNPLAVFDYDRKKDYRFVVTQSEKTFMYNNKAEIVDGFTYTSAENPIISSPKHLRIGSKDYLVFKLRDGSLKILNRIGDIRTPMKEKIDFSENDVYLNKDKFTLTDKKGTLFQIDGGGKVSKTNFNLSNDHGICATDNTLVLMNDNMLTIRGKQIELELGVYTRPKIFYLNNKIYVSVTDLQHQKIYLFDSQAKPINNFPVFGSSLIDLNDIDNDKKLEVVTKGSDDTILTYKIN